MRASLRQLQIFQAVARSLSYTRAAEDLHLTQPAVFTQVRQLEDQLGAPLIERIGKRLFLTGAGEVVLASAREVLEELERMEMRLADLRGMARGRLRLAAVYAPIGAVLGEWVGGSKGLGYLMLLANGRAKTDLVFAALLALASEAGGREGVSEVVGAVRERLTARVQDTT